MPKYIFQDGMDFVNGVVRVKMQGIRQYRVHIDLLNYHSQLLKDLLQVHGTIPELPHFHPEAVDHFWCLAYGKQFWPSEDLDNQGMVHHAWRLVEVADYLGAGDDMYGRIQSWFDDTPNVIDAHMLSNAFAKRPRMPLVYALHFAKAVTELLSGKSLREVLSQDISQLPAEPVLTILDVVEQCKKTNDPLETFRTRERRLLESKHIMKHVFERRTVTLEFENPQWRTAACCDDGAPINYHCESGRYIILLHFWTCNGALEVFIDEYDDDLWKDYFVASPFTHELRVEYEDGTEPAVVRLPPVSPGRRYDWTVPVNVPIKPDVKMRFRLLVSFDVLFDV